MCTMHCHSKRHRIYKQFQNKQKHHQITCYQHWLCRDYWIKSIPWQLIWFNSTINQQLNIYHKFISCMYYVEVMWIVERCWVFVCVCACVERATYQANASLIIWVDCVSHCCDYYIFVDSKSFVRDCSVECKTCIMSLKFHRVYENYHLNIFVIDKLQHRSR